MCSSPVMLCALLVGLQAAVLASSVPANAAQRSRSAKIADTPDAYYSQQFQPVAVAERRSDSYKVASPAHYQSSTGYQSGEVASYHQKPAGESSPRLFDLGSLFYGLQANWPGVLIAVLLVIGTIIVVPWIASKLLNDSNPGFLNLGGYGRAENGADSSSLLTMLDEALRKYDVDSTACMQRGVCSYVRQAALNVVEGRADSTDLILDGLTSNSYLTSWLDGTSILEASDVGRSGASCAETFSTCSLTADSVIHALQDYAGGAQ